MKKQDFKKNTDADLIKTLAQKREELRTFRFGTAGSVSRDVKAFHTNKKDVARILTELNVRSQSV